MGCSNDVIQCPPTAVAERANIFAAGRRGGLVVSEHVHGGQPTREILAMDFTILILYSLLSISRWRFLFGFPHRQQDEAWIL
jgi:hypothetical protein